MLRYAEPQIYLFGTLFFFLPFAFPFTHSFPIILDECIRYLYFIL